MPLWLWVLLLAALIKLPIAALMLWIPFRNDAARWSPEGSDSSEDDGGSRALPGGPLEPHPRAPAPRAFRGAVRTAPLRLPRRRACARTFVARSSAHSSR